VQRINNSPKCKSPEKGYILRRPPPEYLTEEGIEQKNHDKIEDEDTQQLYRPFQNGFTKNPGKALEIEYIIHE
jgi:hypothetical protein